MNNQGSIAPLLIFIIAILFIGFFCGVFGYLIIALQSVETPEIDVGGGHTIDVNTGMDTLMGNAWLVIPFLVLIIGAAWLLMSAQKEKWGGEGL